MSNFTSFAVAGGSGNVGRHIVGGLVAANAARVVVLSRSADTAVPAGVEIKAVDYSSPASIESALEGVEVLISCFRLDQGPLESAIARAAKSAGVQLFLPSHWGAEADLLPPGSPLYFKKEIGELCKQIGLPELKVNVGCFPDTTFAPARFGFDFTNGKVEVVGEGDTPYSFTTEHSIGEYVGRLLTRLAPTELVKLGAVNIEGDRLTINECLALYKQLHPDRPLAVSYTPLADSMAYADKLDGWAKFTRWGAMMWAQGVGDVTQGGKVSLNNGLVEWKPESVKDFFSGMEFVPSEGVWAYYDERDKSSA